MVEYKGQMVEVEDVTPTWRQIVDTLIQSLENGDEEGKKHARAEVRRMARIIDLLNDKTEEQ